jgi:hypothetical protein
MNNYLKEFTRSYNNGTVVTVDANDNQLRKDDVYIP